MSMLLYFIAIIIYVYLLISVRFLKMCHMLQLNSYYNSRFFSYIKANIKQVASVKTFLPLLSLFLLFINIETAVSGFVLIYLFCNSKIEPQKKPLVFTDRVKRQFFTATVLTMALVSSFYFLKEYALLGLLLVDILMPFITMLVNVINSPFENAIKKKFYNEAKSILEKRSDLIIIGVTGSFGKTSMKNFLNALLSEKYLTLMTPGNFNTTMGVVRTVNEYLKPIHEVFIVEMGAKNVGDIKEICDLVHPKYGVISAIGPQHLETFKTQENITNTKFELKEATEKDTFLNIDNIFAYEKREGSITYGKNEDSTYRVINIKTQKDGTEFTLLTPTGEETFKTSLLGEHNIVNLAGAVAVAITLGVDMGEIKSAISRLKSVEHRLELKKGNITIIDDAYNSNPAGASSALKVLSSFTDFTRILITPGMVELGHKQDEYNYEFGKEASICADYIILVGEKQAPPIKKGVLDGHFDEEKLFVAKNINEAFIIMRELKGDNKVVLLENDLPDNFI